MSDKLQFVAGFRHSITAEDHDKPKLVGHFRVCQRRPERLRSKGYRHFM